MKQVSFNISDNALEILKKQVSENSRDGKIITVCSSGTGCGGPLLKVDFRPPLEDDLVQENRGIEFRIRSNIVERLDGADFVVQETFWGKKIKIDNGNICL